MRRIVFCALFLVFVSSIAIAQEIPTLQKYVNDNAGVLSSSDIARINTLAAEIEDNTTVQIAVLTVNSTEPMTIEQYAVEVFEKAGIGYEDKDNGLLMVVAINDRRWRLEVGYGLEPVITDLTASLIGRTYMTPAFQEGRYGDGIYDAVDAVYKVIQNSGDTSFISEQADTDIETVIPVIIMLFFVFIPMIFFFVSAFSAPKCPKCGGKMKCHEEGDYIVCECIKCKKKIRKKKKNVPWWLIFFVGSRGGGRGGGFSGGGFGGGSSGGGGASGGW